MRHEVYTPLIAATAHSQSMAIERILEVPGVEIDAQNEIGQTALHYAAARGDEGAFSYYAIVIDFYDIVKLLRFFCCTTFVSSPFILTPLSSTPTRQTPC